MATIRLKRVASFLLSMVLLLSLSAVFCLDRASAAELDQAWQFEITGTSSATITGYIGNELSITVPKTVVDGNGKKYNVTRVESLFIGTSRTKATSVKFSSGIKEIGDGAFDGYAALTSVQFPDTLKSIGSNAFFGCTSLKGITLPSTVTSIGTSAFEGCTGLISADLSCGVTVIPERLFRGCTKLANVTLPLYVTDINVDAFNGCTNLQKIDIPDTVKTIGANAFNRCSALADLRMPAELKTIGDYAFSSCTSLTKVFLRNKVNSIKEGAFRDCSSLTEIYLSPSVIVIERDIFQGCRKLEKVVFGGAYVPFGSIFDAASFPVVYYPSSKSASWADYFGKKESYIATNSVTISGAKTLTPSKTCTLKVTLGPAAGAFKNVYSISSNNTKVATVSDAGIVTAKGAGVATITVTDINGTTGTCQITVKPAAPTGLKVTPKSTSSVELKWTDAKVGGYYVYRSTSKTGTYKKVASVLTNSYTDKGLTKGKTYYYKLVAYTSAAGKNILSSYSAVKSVTVSAPAPSTISATKTSSGTANIKWGKSTGAAGYQVCMATSSTGTYTVVATVNSASTLSYKKTGLTAGKTYYFKVRSYITVNGTKVYSPYTTVVKVKV